MAYSFVFSTALALMFAIAPALAQPPEGDESILEKQRELYSQAEALASRPSSKKFQQLVTQLDGYPLLPYLEQQQLTAAPTLANKRRIDTFLAEYDGTPLDRSLRKNWLTYLANNKQESLFLQYYRDLGSATLACKQIQYRLKRPDERQQALKDVESLWLVGKSQPKACDPVFRAWVKAGLRSDELVWQRLVLAADGGASTLIPFLRSLLPKQQQYLADLWLKVRRSPSYVAQLSKFPNRFPEKEAEILSYGLTRLIWKDVPLALSSWHKINERFTLSDEQQQRVANKFAVALAIDDHEMARHWLERANQLTADKEVFRWHLAHTLRQQDWTTALDIIDMMPQALAQDYAFQYWQARAYENMDAAELANERFTQLAGQRHYYGFLASAKLARPPSMLDRPVNLTRQQLAEVANMPGARRAYEFLQLSRYTSARREWIYLQRGLDEQQKLAAAVVADSWGWHDQAIFAFARVGYMDDIKRRFPLAYSEQLVSNAEKHNVDPAWAFAIARRESSFMIDANSGAGARGLMQLMPGTARYLAKKKVKTSSLYDPAQNAQFGTQYLRYLMDKMNNNPILATASYNAGWRRVMDWLPEDGSLPVDVWIENIPYKETRNYVKAVLAYRQIYAMQLGRQSNIFEHLPQMQMSASMLN